VRCTSPRTVGFQKDGKTLSWSPKHYSKEYPTFQLPCGKCLSCRLERARETAVRCVHEAQMHENSSFITLTYSDENLKSPTLDYTHIQKFLKKLRKTQNEPLSIFATGEYGDQNKRPHWHLLIFNYRPADSTYLRSNDRGDKLYKSDTLDDLWGYNDSTAKPNEIGEVTFQSAGYVARYATKKLYHGHDGTHPYEPISRRSTKHAIGKLWIEKYWKQTFDLGYIMLPTSNGPVRCSIPRYYEKWLKKHEPLAWRDYVTKLKLENIKKAEHKEALADKKEKLINLKRSGLKGLHIKNSYARNKILEQKTKHTKEQKC